MTRKQLIAGLNYAKQSTTGSKQNLRDRLLIYRNILVIPSDVSSCEDDDSNHAPSPKRKKKNKAKAKTNKGSSSKYATRARHSRAEGNTPSSRAATTSKRSRKSQIGTNKRKSRSGKTKTSNMRKHQAVWIRDRTIVDAAVRAMPEHAWRISAKPRSTCEVIGNMCVRESLRERKCVCACVSNYQNTNIFHMVYVGTDSMVNLQKDIPDKRND